MKREKSIKKLYLHIGSYKTGTSSIQHILYNNSNALKRQGFLYPGEDENHHKFYFATDSNFDAWPRPFKSIQPEYLKKNIGSYFSSLQKDLRSDYRNQIISTEYLFISDRSLIRNVINYLRDFFSEIEIVVFVREPGQYFRSMQQQMIKARSFITSPFYFKYVFKDVIEAWSNFCKVHVLKYSKDISSWRSLCHKVGIRPCRLSQINQRQNESISVEQMILLEKIQRNLYSDQEDIFKTHLDVIHRVQPSFTHKPILKKGLKNILQNAHYKDLQWLESNYGINFIKDTQKRIEPKLSFREDGKRIQVRDVYQVNEITVQRYETVFINFLLKNIQS